MVNGEKMIKEMPSQKEQDMVVWYVLKRPLVRPDTSCKKVIICVIIFLLANIGISILLYFWIRWLGIFCILPKAFRNFYENQHFLFVILLILFQFILGGMIAAKPAIIGVVRLYQRYAPEHIRRKCLFKPTCSEYTIMVVKKYGVIRGLYKAYVRVFKKCKGGVYRIDEP